MSPISFLDGLEAETRHASAAEEAFRRQIVARTRELEQQRAFSFRRLNLMRAVTEAVTAADAAESASASAAAVLRGRLGWVSESEARAEVLARFEPVTRAVFAAGGERDVDGPPPDIRGALAEFESWYAATHPVPFWTLFENVMPETPVVDF